MTPALCLLWVPLLDKHLRCTCLVPSAPPYSCTGPPSTPCTFPASPGRPEVTGRWFRCLRRRCRQAVAGLPAAGPPTGAPGAPLWLGLLIDGSVPGDPETQDRTLYPRMSLPVHRSGQGSPSGPPAQGTTVEQEGVSRHTESRGGGHLWKGSLPRGGSVSAGQPRECQCPARRGHGRRGERALGPAWRWSAGGPLGGRSCGPPSFLPGTRGEALGGANA